jgi:hypothetical protein
MTVVSFDHFVRFVREFGSISPKVAITRSTRFENDLGITGDDGCDLLLKTEQHFGVRLWSDTYGYRHTFGLRPNEHLFHSEGFDILGLFQQGSVREFTVGELYDAISQADSHPLIRVRSNLD